MMPTAEEPIRLLAALGDSSPPAPAVSPARAGRTGCHRLAEGNPDFAYRNLAFEGATSAECSASSARPAARARPGHGRLRRQRRAPLGAPGRPRLSRRLAGIVRRLREALPAVRIVAATAPERWTSSSSPAHPPARRARHRPLQCRHAHCRQGSRIPCLEVAGHPGLSDEENFVATACTHRRSVTSGRVGFARLLGLDPKERTWHGNPHRRLRPPRGREERGHARAHDHRTDLVSFSALTGDASRARRCGWAARARSASASLTDAGALLQRGPVPIDPERVVALRGLRNVVFERPVPIGSGSRLRPDPGLQP